MTAEQTASWQEFSEIAAALNYFVLATADGDGTPWATPAYFRSDDAGDLYWVSSPDSRHSLNIAARAAVSATIFDSTVPIGGARAGYVTGQAGRVDDDEIPTALAILNRGMVDDRLLVDADVRGDGGLRIYRLRVQQRWILVPGRDPRTSSPIDGRLPVDPPPRA
ncbi:pyridoxamine 5'-phosphate oxidase family protein [Microlunatus soli]|uniref:Pyridoxamine 5'-phosphate oxidase n=1 Tax=Microlunatus soli TaxID=630515 RepID=A0A1H1SL33_9ACTN|nr:pyridoxamine 5'-phosphate oxidase family protein [Microlunatus soli]SDS48734.1 Pyridoxamine 5'-phosphate oxidase [Microlunatus soli]